MTTEAKKAKSNVTIEIIDDGNKLEMFQQLLNIGLKDVSGRTITQSALAHFRVKTRLEG